jgi:crotonobetainyl-CoA:carnitine CoA-transferase CaiB-like acyl-CoA transferase
MVLADFGADVVRIDRPGGTGNPDVLCRYALAFPRPCPNHRVEPSVFLSRSGKRSISLNLKLPAAVKLIKSLARKADVVIDPFRPGVLHKLGLGAEDLRRENKGLVYASITGYGQTGTAFFLFSFFFFFFFFFLSDGDMHGV